MHLSPNDAGLNKKKMYLGNVCIYSKAMYTQASSSTNKMLTKFELIIFKYKNDVLLIQFAHSFQDKLNVLVTFLVMRELKPQFVLKFIILIYFVMHWSICMSLFRTLPSYFINQIYHAVFQIWCEFDVTHTIYNKINPNYFQE